MSEQVIEQTIKFIQREAIKFKKLRIYWFGGEPTVALPIMYKITNNLYNFCVENNISYKATMATNLSLINIFNYKTIIDNLHLDKIEFAFDGIGQQHNKIKNYNKPEFDAFNHNLQMLDILLKNNITVLMRLNSDKRNFDGLLHLLDELCERYKSYSNFKPYWAMIFPTETYKDTQDIIHSYEYANYILRVIHVIQKHGAGMDAYPLRRSINNCYGTNPNSIVIGVDGILTKCQSCPSSSTQTIGSVFEGVQRNDTYKKWIYENLIPDCQRCSIFPICLGGCTDAYLSNSLLPCKKEKYYIDKLLIDEGCICLIML